MKKTITTLLLTFSSIVCLGQMHVGETLNDIKEEYSYGKLERNTEYNNYTYTVIDAKSKDLYMYFLDLNLKCYLAIINPCNSGNLQGFIELLNNKWVIIDKFHWRLYRGDGSTMSATAEKIEDVSGICISFKIEQ